MPPDEAASRVFLREHAGAIAEMLLAGDRVLLCIDFDGTLVPLQGNHRLCVLDPQARAMIAAAHAPPRSHVAIVSGRAIADLRERVGVRSVTYAGNHGLEIEGDGLAFREPTAVGCTHVLDGLANDLDSQLVELEGAMVERKGLSLTIHVRHVHASSVPAVRAVVRHAVASSKANTLLAVREGKGVLEILPDVGWHKGRAVEWIADRLGCRTNQRVFIGDDRTDEDGFLACRDGITIRVGDPGERTAARYIASLEDVRLLLATFGGRVKGMGAGYG